MRKAKRLFNIFILLNLYITGLLACPIEDGGFMPDSNLSFPRDKSFLVDPRETILAGLVERFQRSYGPIVAEQGGNLKFNIDLDNDLVNAFAFRDLEKNWVVGIKGGLVRHNLMTKDALSMVICHELGHHLGGAPRLERKFGPGPDDFASVDGQSDYFASMKCFRKVFAVDNNEEVVKGLIIDATAKLQCALKYGVDSKDYFLCQRISAASYVLGKILNGGREVSFINKDRTIVAVTNMKHPKAQCRLDTYFAGALCDNTLPTSNTNTKDGMCNRSEGDSLGARPLCWFKPSSELL